MEVDTEDAQQRPVVRLPSVAQQTSVDHPEDEIDWSEGEDFLGESGPSNSAVAQPNVASSVAKDDKGMQDLTSTFKLVSTSGTASPSSGLGSDQQPLQQVASSSRRGREIAAERHFARAMDDIARSNANAGLLPGSSNRFNALAEPVHASPVPTLRQAMENMEQLRAARSKRLRSPSPDSSHPNKTARTEEDVEMEENAPEPFNFREIVDPKSSSQCFIKVDDGEWFGATNGKLPNYQVNVQVLGGRMGTPMIKICFSICKEEFFNKPTDKNRGAVANCHELFCTWQPGLILDPNNPEYQLSDLKISHRLNRNDQVAMPPSLATITTDLLTKVVGISFQSNK